MFDAFEEAPATKLTMKRLSGDAPHYLWRLYTPVDIDNDGRLERVFYHDFEGYGDGRAGLPYTEMVIVEKDDPAFGSIMEDDIHNLFKLERLRADAASSNHDFLTWNDFRFFDMGVKDHRVPARNEWPAEEVRSYFRKLGFEGPMSEYFGSGIPGNAFARVGTIKGQGLFYFKANLDHKIMGPAWRREHTDEKYRYTGPQYEFLATYHDPETFDFLCAREVVSDE